MFRSARHALQFTFRTLGTPIIKMSSINNMRGGGGNSDMTPHDRHAQAALIMSMVERACDVTALAYLKAHYAGGFNFGDDADKTRESLLRAVMAAMPTGMRSSKGVFKLITNYFGGNISMTSVRIDFKCRNEQCQAYKRIASDTLDVIGRRAEDDVYRVLDAAGLIKIEVTV